VALRKTVLALAVVALALTAMAAPAGAQAPAPIDERAAAREFSYAAYRLRVAIKARLPQIDAAAALTRDPVCREALQGGSAAQARAHVDDLVGVLVDMLAGAMFAPVADGLHTFGAELDRIPTADPALRSGRAAWRGSIALYVQARPLPADLCARLRRWKRAGWAARAAPDLQPPAVRAILDGSGTGDAKLQAAAARLVALGVPAGQARRFAGDTLFAGFSPEGLLGLGPASGVG
jgi:hypothetical protein